MQALAQQWDAQSDRRAIFLKCYLLMTHNMLAALSAGEFHDTDWVHALLDRFAGYYFTALEAFEQRSPTTPAVWQVAHGAAHLPQTMSLQHLFLGINAHINYDLVLALAVMLEPEWDHLADEQRAQRHADFCYVNHVIGQTIDAVQERVIDPISPGIEVMDMLMRPVDDWVASHLIIHWRDKVWQHVVTWLTIHEPATREGLRKQIEADTLHLSHLILLER